MLVNAVNELARGLPSETTIQFIKSLSRPLQDDILNEAIHLFARNADVDLFNYDKIQKIPSQLYIYMFQSEDEGSTDFLKKILAPKFFGIKIGVPVILLINMSNKLVNRRIGIVTEVNASSATITVQFEIGVAVGRVKTINGLMVNNVRSSLIKRQPNSVYKLSGVSKWASTRYFYPPEIVYSTGRNY